MYKVPFWINFQWVVTILSYSNVYNMSKRLYACISDLRPAVQLHKTSECTRPPPIQDNPAETGAGSCYCCQNNCHWRSPGKSEWQTDLCHNRYVDRSVQTAAIHHCNCPLYRQWLEDEGLGPVHYFVWLYNQENCNKHSQIFGRKFCKDRCWHWGWKKTLYSLQTKVQILLVHWMDIKGLIV